MSSPPRTNAKPPIENFLATFLIAKRKYLVISYGGITNEINMSRSGPVFFDLILKLLYSSYLPRPVARF